MMNEMIDCISAVIATIVAFLFLKNGMILAGYVLLWLAVILALRGLPKEKG